MRYSRLFVVLVFMLLMCSAILSSPAGAQVSATTTYGSWDGVSYDVNGNPAYTWNDSNWVDNTITIDVDFSAGPGGGSFFDLDGAKNADPIVSQIVLNGSQATWLDWHVDILNGIIVQGADTVVHKVEANAANWEIQYISNPGYTSGFGARWIGDNSGVGNGQHLSVRFKWVPNGQGPVTIRQYPTDTGAFIPEPSSILALASGLASMGFAFYRKRI